MRKTTDPRQKEFTAHGNGSHSCLGCHRQPQPDGRVAPDDVAIGRIIVILVDRMNLPLNSPDGQLMSYKLHHKRHRSTVARITDAPRRRRDRQRRSAVAT